MRLFRVENINGDGPYRSGGMTDARRAIRDSHDADKDGHPPPHLDGILSMIGRVCGFSSLTQLHRWFSDDELTILENEGYHIQEYESRDVIVGDFQVAFRQTGATRVVYRIEEGGGGAAPLNSPEHARTETQG
jgi:hypothetical protein